MIIMVPEQLAGRLPKLIILSFVRAMLGWFPGPRCHHIICHKPNNVSLRNMEMAEARMMEHVHGVPQAGIEATMALKAGVARRVALQIVLTRLRA